MQAKIALSSSQISPLLVQRFASTGSPEGNMVRNVLFSSTFNSAHGGAATDDIGQGNGNNSTQQPRQ